MFLSINNNTCLLAFIRKNVAVQNFRKAVVVLFLCISTAVMMMMKSTTKNTIPTASNLTSSM